MVTISILVPLVEVEESKILELRRLLLLLLLDPECLVLCVGHSVKLLVVYYKLRMHAYDRIYILIYILIYINLITSIVQSDRPLAALSARFMFSSCFILKFC